MERATDSYKSIQRPEVACRVIKRSPRGAVKTGRASLLPQAISFGSPHIGVMTRWTAAAISGAVGEPETEKPKERGK
jgi:hypothetical protein